MAIKDPAQVDSGLGALAGRYLTFRTGTESYGIPVLAVREIIRKVQITAVPGIPAHYRGVINLRGRVIPAIDLKHRFGMGVAEEGEHSCIVVVQVGSVSKKSSQMGLMVDAVEEVVSIATADLAETPDFGFGVDTSFLLGMAKVRGQVKALLDLDHIVSGEELAGIVGAGTESAQQSEFS
jgi:purine-binding chemotaxis protein CheW